MYPGYYWILYTVYYKKYPGYYWILYTVYYKMYPGYYWILYTVYYKMYPGYSIPGLFNYIAQGANCQKANVRIFP